MILFIHSGRSDRIKDSLHQLHNAREGRNSWDADGRILSKPGKVFAPYPSSGSGRRHRVACQYPKTVQQDIVCGQALLELSKEAAILVRIQPIKQTKYFHTESKEDNVVGVLFMLRKQELFKSARIANMH